jgi:biopolymer transport protein ExbD
MNIQFDRGGAAAAGISKADCSPRVFLRADKFAFDGNLMAKMNVLRIAGCLKVVLIGLETEPLR